MLFRSILHTIGELRKRRDFQEREREALRKQEELIKEVESEKQKTVRRKKKRMSRKKKGKDEHAVENPPSPSQDSLPEFAAEQDGDDGEGVEALLLEDDECLICMERKRNWVLVPCMHCMLCNVCAGPFRLSDQPETHPFQGCPVCRVPLHYPYVLTPETLSNINDSLEKACLVRCP